MKIPETLVERDLFYNDVEKKCTASQEKRADDYSALRQYYLFGGSDGAPPFNKIFPHIDLLTSFLYASETTKFSIHLGASADKIEHARVSVLNQALNDKWLDSNADRVVSNAVTWSLVNNTTLVKLVPRVNKESKTLDISPFMVHPASFGVFREDLSFTDRQEAMTHTYYTTKSQLEIDLANHPQREAILKSVESTNSAPLEEEQQDGIGRLMASTQDPLSAPIATGNVEFEFDSDINYLPQVDQHQLITLVELWIWDTKEANFRIVTKVKQGVTIYDRIASASDIYLPGEQPFNQFCPNPLPHYYWGMSETAGLANLQEWYTERIMQIRKLLNLQVKPPTDASGFGVLDERAYALFSEGGLLSPQDPMAQNPKLNRHAPDLPADLFTVLHEIDQAFSDYSGLPNTIQGKGDSGVRSNSQASTLARLGSSRIKKRALIIEDSLEKMATTYLKLMQKYDGTTYEDENGVPFTAEQFTKDFVVKVDAHSNSPIFVEDKKDLAFKMLEAKLITRERAIDMIDPQDKADIKRDIKTKIEPMEQAAAQAKEQADIKVAEAKSGHTPKPG